MERGHRTHETSSCPRRSGARPRRAATGRDRLAQAGLLCVLWGVLGVVPAAIAQESQEAAPAETLAEQPPSALAQFTTAVENREPIDQVTFVSNDVRKILFFSDLRGLAGRTVTHRWIYDGEVRAEVDFEVRGPRWRVWSSKELLEDWLGDWTVEIVTDEGEVIAAETFTYSAPGA